MARLIVDAFEVFMTKWNDRRLGAPSGSWTSEQRLAIA
jgi:hypothetical protein